MLSAAASEILAVCVLGVLAAALAGTGYLDDPAVAVFTGPIRPLRG